MVLIPYTPPEMPGTLQDSVINSEPNSPNAMNDSNDEMIKIVKEEGINENQHFENGSVSSIENGHGNKNNANDGSKDDSKEKTEVPMKFLDIKVLINGLSEPLTVQLSNHDTVQDIRQVILEKPECCYRTCFSLYLDGTRLDDFMELHDIPGLNECSVVKVVDEPYSIREARIHIRRLRDLLVTMLEPNAFSATDNLSLSYCSAITEIDVEEEAWKAIKDKNSLPKPNNILPPSYAGLESSPLLEPVIIPNYEVQLPSCLKDLYFSAWNPPPGYRKLAGDLLYLEVVTLDNPDHTYNITSSSSGFFVNRITKNLFDPRPANESARSQTLAGLLNIISPLFKKNFCSIQRTTIKKHPLELVASPHQVYPWISPQFQHTQDPFRAEDAVTNRIGYEEQIPGQLRDWNEELQSAKELPKKTQHQRVLRDRALYKITCDFIAAATRGAVAVVDGNVMAINPGEEEKMRMYIWNNIFFSFACDSREHYQKYGGDKAAYSAASLDLKGVELYNKLDVEGLYTLGTVVVDYRGYRIIAQSIIPGILQREQENSVIYGSVDGGKTIATQETFLEKLKTAGLSLKLRPHKIVNEKKEDVELCSSIECKGIIGADGRHYILDLFRSFPPDVNFLEVETIQPSLINGEKIPEKNKDHIKKDFQFPVPHSQQLVSFRPIALEAFIGYKYVSFVKIIAIHKLQDEKEREKGKTSVGESSTDEKKTEDTNNKTDEVDVTKEAKDSSVTPEDKKGEEPNDAELQRKEEESDIKAVEAAAKAIGSLNPREFDIRFNPDAYVPEVQLSSSEEELDRKEKQLTQDMAQFVCNTIIVKMVEDFASLSCTPLDGVAVTEIMHARGINMRYLGKVASLCSKKDNLDYVYNIVVKEMVLRAAKNHFKECLQSANQRCLSAAVSHFLNCFLSSFPSPQPHLPSEENTNKKKKNKKRTQKLPHLPSNNNVAWMSLSPTLLWSSITKHVKKHFGFTIESTNVDTFIETYTVQKISMLREFCKKTGVQILLREYDFSTKKHATFSDDDIVNIFPVVKSITPKATDATSYFEAAQSRLQSGFFGEAHEMMIEALNMFNQVYGPLHADIVVCYRAIARIHYLADDSAQAVAFQKKAVIVAERIYGIDHPETLVAYVHLALYCYHAGLVGASLKLMYRARYLGLLSYGEKHPDMATFDTNIGLMLHSQREFNLACKYLEHSCNLQMKFHGAESLHTATGHHLVARALSALGNYKKALSSERSTHSIYEKHFGADDARTKESSEALKTILNQAVMLQKTLKDIAEKGKVIPSKVPKLDDDKFDKKILTMVNKIEELDDKATAQPKKVKLNTKASSKQQGTKS